VIEGKGFFRRPICLYGCLTGGSGFYLFTYPASWWDCMMRGVLGGYISTWCPALGSRTGKLAERTLEVSPTDRVFQNNAPMKNGMRALFSGIGVRLRLLQTSWDYLNHFIKNSCQFIPLAVHECQDRGMLPLTTTCSGLSVYSID